MSDLMIIDWLNAPEGSANSVQPSTRSRKPKARTLRDSDWAPHKDRITELYSLHPLKYVICIMETETEFRASERQYKSRIEKWSLDKNIKPKEMMSIVRKRQKRKLEEAHKAGYRFQVNKNAVPPAKIDRWMQMHDIPENTLFAPSPAASTPSAVDWRTISEPSTPAYRDSTPIPTFNGLHISSKDGVVTSTFHGRSDSDPDSSGSRSPTPTPTRQEQTESFARAAPLVTDDQNHDEQSDQGSPRNVETSDTEFIDVLMTGPGPLADSDYISFGDIETHWMEFRLQFSLGRESLQWDVLPRLSRCKDMTDQYLTNSQDVRTAKRAVLELAEEKELFMPQQLRRSGTNAVIRTVIRTVLEYWLHIGYDINKRNLYGGTTFLRVCEFPHGWVTKTYLSLLIEHGADVHSRNLYDGRGALHLFLRSIGGAFFYAFSSEQVEEVLVVLLEAGCDPDCQPPPINMFSANDIFQQRKTAIAGWVAALAKTSETRRRLAEQRASTS